ncbi:MAG: hypothetical protein JW839_12550 [Candidatus Lokiarchaeota archaeon]|nr:hypothetical protein [Candidatus Lokiarchaeota archaeon]
MRREILKFMREFGIDATSPLHAEILAACLRKRRCVNGSCKKRLKLVDFLETNIDPEDLEPPSRFGESVRRLVGLWSDPRIELYCCGCFEPAAGAGDEDAGAEMRAGMVDPKRAWRDLAFAFLFYIGGTWLIATCAAGGMALPLVVAGIVAGGLLYLAGMLLFFWERVGGVGAGRQRKEARRAGGSL